MEAKKPEAPQNVVVAHKTEIHLPLDAAKLEAIKECLKKDRLSITITHADISGLARLGGGGYEYD